MRPLGKGWTAPSLRYFTSHHFAPRPFLPSPRARYSPAKALYLKGAQTRAVHKKAGSKWDQGKQPSDEYRDPYRDPYTDEYADKYRDENDNEEGGSSLIPAFHGLGLLLFMVGARERRRRLREEASVDEDCEVGPEGSSG